MRHGSHLDPKNRFEKIHRVADHEHGESEGVPGRAIEYLDDDSRSIVSENDSPDIPFRYSVNPYRGCIHACSYCYARPYHEFLGLNAGLDFETKILVKRAAPRLLKEFLANDRWRPEPIAFSGVTDCYQPAEREFRLTRQCLEVFAACHHPVSLITKNALVERDIDLLGELASRRLTLVNLSLTTLDAELARVMEPRTSTPEARLRAIETLTRAGIPVRTVLAPMIPGLNDHEVPAILTAARQAGAIDANYTLLRLPQTVEPVFLEWLARTQPLRAAKVEGLIRQTREGQLNRTQFGERMRGTGEIAGQIAALFRVHRARLGFQPVPELDCSQFVPPPAPNGQRRLF